MTNRSHWFTSLLNFGKDSKGKIVLSVLLSILSVFSGLVPYWAVYRIILYVVAGHKEIHNVLFYIGIALLAYVLQVIFFGCSTMLSHVTAYDILSTIRKRLAQKLMRLPLGVVEAKKNR